jgi:putative Mg2+ transporter-C (MgtC) family protein
LWNAGSSITRRSSSRRVDGRLKVPAVGSFTNMQMWLADPLFGGAAQNGRHVIELLAAFALTTLIGLERTIQGKSAGLRTQTIVGTSSALVLLISKYGFGDVLTGNTVVLDPSRVAAQIVSGIGFLGAGIIITRRGAVHGLTTAAAVWESAAIGMAAGAALLLLATAVVFLHFVSALAFNRVEHQLSARLRGTVRLHDQVGVTMTLSGAKIANASEAFSAVNGVVAVLRAEDEAD